MSTLFIVVGFYSHIANASLISLTGKTSDGTVNNVYYSELSTEALSTISFDLNIEHIYPSWGNETIISLTHENSGFSIKYDGFNDFGWGAESGLFSFSGTFDLVGGPASIFGNWTIGLYESFDEGGVIDATYGESTITLNTVDVSVSEPVGLSLLGLGALVFLRRRLTKK